ncbi:MAG TPA: hypothetical protein VJA66_11765 [Thermoanaerobaculia bacterium]
MTHRPSIRKLLESFSIPLLLVLVAARQIALSHSESLSPWRGGGFGMFSSLDRAETRLLRCDLVTDSSRIPVDPSRNERLSRLISDIQSAPTSDRLSALGDEVVREVSVPKAGGTSRIHVEVRKLRFRSGDQRLFAELLAYVDRPTR